MFTGEKLRTGCLFLSRFLLMYLHNLYASEWAESEDYRHLGWVWFGLFFFVVVLTAVRPGATPGRQ